MESDINLIKKINLDLFHSLNSFFGKPDYHNIILLIQKSFNSNSIFFYIPILMLTSIFLLYKNRLDEPKFESCFLTNLSCFITFSASNIFCLLFILIIKNHAGVIRPFCQYDNLYQIQEIINASQCTQSFPSGHMSFAVSIVASFWAIFNRFFKFFSITTLIIVGICRIAAGAHYPIDLLGAIVITLPTILYIKPKIYNFSQKLSSNLGLIKIAKLLFKVENH